MKESSSNAASRAVHAANKEVDLTLCNVPGLYIYILFLLDRSILTSSLVFYLPPAYRCKTTPYVSLVSLILTGSTISRPFNSVGPSIKSGLGRRIKVPVSLLLSRC